MPKINPVSRARFRIPLPVILLVLAGAGAWYFFLRDKPPEPVDPFANVQTTPIDGPLEAFQLAWKTSDFDALARYELREPDAEDAAPSDFETGSERLGWHRDGLPEILDRKVERPQKVRYTITWTLTGYKQPLRTFWEWTETGWRIATWALPRE